MMSKITFTNKSSILYNSNSESFVGMKEKFVFDYDLEQMKEALESLSERVPKIEDEEGLGEWLSDVVIRSFGKEFKSLEEYEEYMKTICDCDDPKPYRPKGITAMIMKPHQCQTCGRFPHKKYMS